MSHPGLSRRRLLALASLSGAWPRLLRAQQAQPRRRIAVLVQFKKDEPEGERRVAAFMDELKQLGWRGDENVLIDMRWAAENPALERRYASELVGLAPDVILASGTASTVAMQEVTQSVPIVFVNVADATGAGFVDNLAHPGGNSTGFTLYEFSLAGKWLEILKQMAPSVTRVGVLTNNAILASVGQFAAIQIAAAPLGVEVRSLNARDANELERGIAAFAHLSHGGLVATGGVENLYRDTVIALAGRYRLPAVYVQGATATAGGLVAYGPDRIDQFRRAAGYVNRILKGEKPGDLPVQAPTKYEMVINLKTAKALGLAVPPSLLARADKVIE